MNYTYSEERQRKNKIYENTIRKMMVNPILTEIDSPDSKSFAEFKKRRQMTGEDKSNELFM